MNNYQPINSPTHKRADLHPINLTIYKPSPVARVSCHVMFHSDQEHLWEAEEGIHHNNYANTGRGTITPYHPHVNLATIS